MINFKIQDTYLVFVILYSGLALNFFRSHEGLIALFLFGLLIFGGKLARPTKPLLYALGVWMIYFAINTILIKSFHPFFMATYIAKIIIAWWLLSYYREYIFLKFEKILYYLTIISLFFYTWQIVHYRSLYNIISSIDLSGNLFPDIEYASSLFYTVSNTFGESFPRNAGFTWEPGPFSCYLVLAMFVNLIRNNLQLVEKKKLLLFFAAIVTTQSTTGILALIILVSWLFWVRSHNSLFKFVSIPLIVALVIYLFTNVPVLQEKIVKESQQDVEQMIANSVEYDTNYAPGRFASFQLGMKDFLNYPIAGIGGNTALRYASQKGAEVSTINGLASIMTRYGAIGLIIFLVLITSTGIWLSKFFNFSGAMIFPVLLLIISFAFGIIEAPIIVTMWLVPVFLKYYPQNLVYEN